MKRVFFSLLLVLVVGALVLSGCSTKTSTQTQTSTTTVTSTVGSSSTATQTSTSTTSAKYGGILKLIATIPLDGPLGDPLNVFGPFTFHASIALQRLLFPGDQPGQYKYILATGYKLAPDKSYYDIALRQGVTFHDGTTFNATAVKWNLDRILNATVSELRSVTSVEVIDDYSVRLHLSSWNNQIIDDLTHDTSYMISPTAFEKNGGSDWANLNPIGTGPFMFNAAKSNTQVAVFDRNPNYWEKGLPYLDGVENHFIPDPMAQQAALLAGEVDGASAIATQVRASVANNPDYRTWVEDGEFLRVLYSNTVDPKSAWYDPRMRQALEYAIDKDTVIKETDDPAAVAGYNIIKGLEEVTQIQSVPRKYDSAKAKTLMAAAGYADGVEFTINISAANWVSGSDKQMLAWQQQWADVGFKVNIQQIEAAQEGVFSGAVMPGNDALYWSIRGSKTNPMAVVVENLAPNSRYFTGIKRPADWTDLIAKGLQTESAAEQLAILVQIDKEAYDEPIMVPLDTGPQVSLFNNKVHDIGIQRQGYTLTYTWLDK